uniref:DUF4328 domain-containing protein n=1 Tax=Ignavibacterium album TaxID=591197 RepID=A0A832DE50_9BACT
MSQIENTLSGQEYHYIKDPTSLTKFLKTMLWISLGINLLSLLFDNMQMTLLSAGSFSQAQDESNEARRQIVALLYLGAFIVTGITFLKWIYRANLNCHGFGAQGMKFSPGWSIGYYFIPLLNLYLPYEAMKEIWKVSRNPSDWQNEMGSPLLGWWWALWLISNFLAYLLFRMSMKAYTISSVQDSTIVSIYLGSYLQDSTTVSIYLGVINIPLYLVAISLVSAVFARQENLVKSTFNKTPHGGK